MKPILFDDQLRQLRQLRQRRTNRPGGARFLHSRAFEDCLDRLAAVRRRLRSALLIGAIDPSWKDALAKVAPEVQLASIESLAVAPHTFDLCLCIGELETANDFAASAFALRHTLAPGGLLLGAIVGGGSLPRLRASMLAADRVSGNAAPRVHPMIDGPSLAALLSSSGLIDPVVDVDRLDVRYPSLDRLVGDLREMGCTNILADRSRVPLSRRALDAARAAFLNGDAQAIERFDLLHFAAWARETESGQFEN